MAPTRPIGPKRPADELPPQPAEPTAGHPRADPRRDQPPGEDPGTLTDEEYLSAGGPDALDSASRSH